MKTKEDFEEGKNGFIYLQIPVHISLLKMLGELDKETIQIMTTAFERMINEIAMYTVIMEAKKKEKLQNPLNTQDVINEAKSILKKGREESS